jgi:cytochrome c-type biogenesis protein CcmE
MGVGRGKKRIIVFFCVSTGIILSVALVFFALRDSMVYFVTPSEFLLREWDSEERVRVGGMVAENSIEYNANEIAFILTDYESSIPVRFQGIPPDLFAEKQGVIIEGHAVRKNEAILYFQAVMMLAKHDEKYTPMGQLAGE